MGNKRCFLCDTVQKTGEKGFFGFPSSIKQKNVREKWIEICQIPAETNTKNVAVCFRHFESNQIEEYSNYVRLKAGMITSLNISPISGIFRRSGTCVKSFRTCNFDNNNNKALGDLRSEHSLCQF